jgi:hypothetical protein
MSFLNPIMLFGLAAVSIPIVIHLLNRRRVKKVLWAAMRFLSASIEQNRRRMKMEDLILLAVRCLLLALLALALARPSFESAGTILGTSRATAVLIIDNSYSMDMSDGTETRFDKARRTAEQAVANLGAGSSAAVWFVSDTLQTPIPEPTLDLNLARKAIREGSLSHRATDLLPALSKAVDVLRSRFGLRKEIYLFTDGQALGWQRFDEILKLCASASHDLRLNVVLINEHETRNVGVSELRLASGLSPLQHPLRFQVRITNFGIQEARDTRATLAADDEAPCDEFTIPSLGPGASQSVALFAKLSSVGFHTVSASIARDRLHADDLRQWVVRGISEARVLLVNGDPGQDPRDNETFFLQHALAPVQPENRAEYFLKVTVVPPDKLLSTSLNDFDAIILANVAELSEPTSKELQEFVRRGGGLIIFPGAKVNTRFYNEQLVDRFGLLPARFDAVAGDANQDEKFVTLQEKDYQHPVVAIWGDPASGTLSSTKFFQYFKMALAEPKGKPGIVLAYADGSPAVVEWTVGLGRVFQFSSTGDTAWNDWPVRPSFVPMLHRTLGAIVQRKDEGLNIAAGEPFMRRMAPEFVHKDAVVTRRNDAGAGAEARRVELLDDAPSLRFEDTDRAGLYDVRIAEPPLSEMFAVEPNAAESNLEELSPKQLESLGQLARVATWSPKWSLDEEMARARGGADFWMPLLLLGLGVALAEMMLAQWFSRST